MSRKLSWEEMSESISAANMLRQEYGGAFKATVRKKENHGKNYFDDIDVFITHGKYDDANMPCIYIDDLGDYDCAYVRMKYSAGCLTIYSNDTEIDIMPDDK